MVDAVYVDLYSEISRQVADAMDRFIAGTTAGETGQRRDGDGTQALANGVKIRELPC